MEPRASTSRTGRTSSTRSGRGSSARSRRRSAARSPSSPTSRGRRCGSASCQQPVTLERGDEVVVAAQDDGSGDELPVSPTASARSCMWPRDPDRRRARPVARRERRARARRCVVVAGGIVETHKGVNVPGVPVPIPSLTRKDMDDLEFALDLGVDFVALSFVRSAADVRDLRELITAARRARARDRQDREVRGRRRAGCDSRRGRRGHGRPRRPRRRDRRRARAAPPEADHPARRSTTRSP